MKSVLFYMLKIVGNMLKYDVYRQSTLDVVNQEGILKRGLMSLFEAGIVKNG